MKIIVFSNGNNNPHAIIAALNHFYMVRTPIYHISKNSKSEKTKPLYALHNIVQRFLRGVFKRRKITPQSYTNISIWK